MFVTVTVTMTMVVIRLTTDLVFMAVVMIVVMIPGVVCWTGVIPRRPQRRMTVMISVA